ncbi:MAG: stage V sporulation protein AE [Bacillaceae bacterium]
MKKKVIIITDGDEYAKKTIEHVASFYGGRCISRSQANPTILNGRKLVELVLQTPYDPVFIMFDDSGFLGEGTGEKALKYVVNHKHIDVLGILAVASKTRGSEWTKVDFCIDNEGNLTEFGVDKWGIPDHERGRISGDTVYCLDELNVPIIIGIGDIGKMGGADDIKKGSPITKQAIQIILERNGLLVPYTQEKDE